MLIAITGPKGSGKSTVALTLTRMGFRTIAFAHPLKAMLQELLVTRGVDHITATRMLYGDLKEMPTAALGGCTPRHAMQTLGTEWGRMLLHPDFWVDAWKDAIGQLRPATDVVTDDLRFPNEAAAVRALGGEVWLVTRPGVEPSADPHVSEHQFATLGPSTAIDNSGTIDELRDAVLRALRARRGIAA